MVETKIYKVEIEHGVFEMDGGKKFDTYKAFTKDGKKITLKFTQAVANLPKENGFIYVSQGNINLDTSRKYPRFWVKHLEKFEPKVIEAQDLKDYFGE